MEIALFSVVFWIIGAIFFLIALSAIAYDSGPGSIAILIATFIVAEFLITELHPFTWLVQHWGLLLVYPAIGLLWSFLKWYFYVKNHKSEFGEKGKGYHNESHKSMITSWISLWPFSMIWFLLNDPWRWIVDWFSKVYKGIADSALR